VALLRSVVLLEEMWLCLKKCVNGGVCVCVCGGGDGTVFEVSHAQLRPSECIFFLQPANPDLELSVPSSVPWVPACCHENI
jgi:hypothetical protein